MKLDVVFVCQQGELEVMSALLAASLRQVCGSRVHLHAIEPMPREIYGTISPPVRKFLDGLEVRWQPFRNPISDDYKIFNKLNAFNILPQGDRILFLDSDTLVRRALEPLRKFFSRPFAAKSANKQRFSADPAKWAPVYRLFDVPLPQMRWPGSDSHEWAPPYFNAGVILVDPALDFSRHWIDTCRRIHLDETIEMANRGTVQVGLPVVLFRRHIPYALLDQRFNFGLSKGWLQTRRPWADHEAHIVHYFNPKNLTIDPLIHHEVRQLVKDFQLEDILALSEGGHKLLKSFKREPQKTYHHSALFKLQPATASPLAATSQDDGAVAPSASRSTLHAPRVSPASRMAFITGIPGSGAGWFASLLAELPAITVLHDPKIKEAFAESENLNALSLTWKKWRADFNKTKANDDWVLAAKNTLGFLTHLERIAGAFPEATIFVLVRHPFDTIARWMAVPPLREAEFIDKDDWAGIDAPFLSGAQRHSLGELQRLPDLAMKRAGLWDYFSGLARLHAEPVHIIRYEDLRANPPAVLRHAYGCLFPGRALELPELDFSAPRSALAPAGVLTEHDQECIRAICSNNAGVFDYYLYE
ncbi:MAG: sulfotransferase [candidate division KSB1 bacterium]|nr:sulfotransferase [candidate division KSB1 bacterium]MDZ7365079.1 sulfotransferase [candidate division KSB1 bacterium]MDZ7407253.1 sulfotransferase [candidate division KSB1 bacterium]